MPSSRTLPAVLTGLGLLACGLVATTPAAHANPAGTGLVISEVYGAGGNAGATLTSDYIELYNPTDTAIDVSTWSVQYRSSAGTTAQVTRLTGTVQPRSHYLVQEATGSGGTQPLPTPDATGTIAMSGSAGQVLLVAGTTPFTSAGDLAGHPALVDMVGYGASARSYETAPTGVDLTASTSAQRAATGADSDHNANDFVELAPAPRSSGSAPDPGTDPEPETATIAAIQGTGETSPKVGTTVRTRGVVTANYPSGGFNGFYIQTPGTGSGDDQTPGASDGLFVYGQNVDESTLSIGDYVEVTGPVAEYAQTVGGVTSRLTQVTPQSASDVTRLSEAAAAPEPLVTEWFATDAAREAHEGELVRLTGPLTVTNSYATHQYGEIGLAVGTTPLIAPTEIRDAQTGNPGEIAAQNAARLVTLDDGSTRNFTGGARGEPMSWLTPGHSVRTGAAATLHSAVVVDHRNGAYKIQPPTVVTGEGAGVATFAQTRTAAPEPVGGDIRLATFNVLNYFPTTGADFEAAGLGTCSYYNDRAGNPITVNSCSNNGPRGAANQENLERQQAKIVAAINTLDASIVGLEEIENSAQFGKDRDYALGRLVDALNADAGAGTWAFVPSPPASERPAISEEDVIRTAFIYRPADVTTVGESQILRDEVNFDNAREPLAQAFKGVGQRDVDAFGVIVNHFKSKGSGVDDGTGQGNANPDRIGQAHALSAFADEFAASRGTDAVFLAGDFNSYSQEDPMQVLYDDGYVAVESDTHGEETYVFGGLVGSLDHVLANDAGASMVTGADVWNINAVEPVGFEYSRYNANATDLYAADVFRSSDHDPEIVGLDLPDPAVTTLTADAEPVPYGSEGTVQVRVSSDSANGAPIGGQVTVRDGDRVLGTADVAPDGTASVVLPARSLEMGQHVLAVAYSGDAGNAPSSGSVSVEVVKAEPTLDVVVGPGRVTTKTPVTLDVTLTAPGQEVTGWVGVAYDGDHQATRLTDGSARFDLGRFTKAGTYTVWVGYSGSDTVKQAWTRVTVTVEKS